MQRDEVRELVKTQIKCTDYLDKSRKGGYICKKCGSGTHENKSGAVKFYEGTNTWFCHSCHTKGDVIDLLMLEYKLDYDNALKYGADLLELTIDKWDGGSDTPRAVVKSSVLVDEEPAQQDYTEYYKTCVEKLAASAAAISYLQARGISIKTAQALNIGFDPKADPANYPGAIDPTRNKYPTPRIIIPTSKTHYVGRSIDPKTPASFMKINNSGGVPHIFNLAALYGGCAVIYIAEGAFDAMSYAEVGAAAVALNSTSNTEKLLQQLTQLPAAAETKFVVSFDNDTDPKTAEKTDKAADELLQGLKNLGYQAIKYNVAGACKDVNDLLQQDKAQLKRNIDAAAAAFGVDEEPAQQDYLTEFLVKIQTEAYKPYTTELSFFDKLLNGGVIAQSLLILMAAPGMGKTTLCQQIAEEMAAHQKPIIYFNLEMSRDQMIAKAISYRLAKAGQYKTALKVLQGYNWSDTDRQQVTAAVDRYRQEVARYLEYNPRELGNDIDAIMEYMKEVADAAKAKGRPAPAIILDYIHLCSTTKKLDTQELLKHVVKSLKGYAIKYNTFAIGISAVNRSSIDRITLVSGRDSSNIEYTGDYQLGLNYYDLECGDDKSENMLKLMQKQKWRRMILKVLKGRWVSPGASANLYFNAAYNIYYGENDEMPEDIDRIPFNLPLSQAQTEQKNNGLVPIKRKRI